MGGPSTRRGSSTGRSTEQSVDLRSEQRSTRGARRQQLTTLVDERVRRQGGSSTGALVDQGHLVVDQRGPGGRPGALGGRPEPRGAEFEGAEPGGVDYQL
ncbi:unnamed protein product [Closterium sp. NIES-53]